MISARPWSWLPSTQTTSTLRLGLESLRMKPRNFQCSFFQASEIEVGKNIAQQNEAAILIFLENAQRLAGAAHVRAEVQIREDHRVVYLRRHSFDCRQGVLRGDELGID